MTAISLRVPSHTRADLRFAWGLLWRCLALIAVGSVLTAILWTLVPMAFGYRPNLVISDSMTPRIRAGDVVLTRHIDRADVRPGDVVLMDDASRPAPLLHRVRSIDGGRIVTQGDANPTPDVYGSADVPVMGIGRVLVPRIGVAVLALRSRPEVTVALFGGGLCVAGVAFLRRGRRRRPIGVAASHYARRRDDGTDSWLTGRRASSPPASPPSSTSPSALVPRTGASAPP
ncbi:MAG: signal peptidase I [Acidimicrobiales bacterium]